MIVKMLDKQTSDEKMVATKVLDGQSREMLGDKGEEVNCYS